MLIIVCLLNTGVLRSFCKNKNLTPPHLSLIVRCGEYNDSIGGVITSPDYPNNYPSDYQCMWFINLPRAYRVNISVIDSGIQYCENCECDALEVSINFLFTIRLIIQDLSIKLHQHNYVLRHNYYSHHAQYMFAFWRTISY